MPQLYGVHVVQTDEINMAEDDLQVSIHPAENGGAVVYSVMIPVLTEHERDD